MLFQCVLVLCLGASLSQRDCTGVDCPVLHNCIEEVLEKGACCSTCVKTGCACEGYQYYDCVNAGFRNGKVPEGESYFVDFGSTECSCPQGGGRISCRFIPCPEIPANCVEILQPADGCPECMRIGCAHDNQKYEAGHSFQMDPCKVCHCPNNGGRLMCSPVPDCDPREVKKPKLTATTEYNNPLRDSNHLHDKKQTSPLEPLSKLHKMSPRPSNTLPLYKEAPDTLGEEEDYPDYTPADPTTTSPQDPAQPMGSTAASPVHSESSSPYSIVDDDKQELRERLGTYDQERREEAPEIPRHTGETTSRAQGETTTTTTTTKQEVTSESHRREQEADARHSMRHGDRHRAMKDTAHTAHAEQEVKDNVHHEHRGSHSGHDSGHVSQSHGRHEKPSEEPRQPQNKQEQVSSPTVKFSPTSRAPVKMREELDHLPRTQPQTLSNYQDQNEERNNNKGKSKPKLCMEQCFILRILPC